MSESRRVLPIRLPSSGFKVSSSVVPRDSGIAALKPSLALGAPGLPAAALAEHNAGDAGFTPSLRPLPRTCLKAAWVVAEGGKGRRRRGHKDVRQTDL